MPQTRTLTARPARGANAERSPEPVLVIALHAGQPLLGSSRHRLAGLRTVELRRAAARTWEREDARLVLGLPDPRVSAPHARLSLQHGRWVLEDLGSKNGSRVNGVPQQRALLSPGDRVEVGQTLLLFLHRRVGRAAEWDLDTDGLRALPDGLPTLHPELAEELSRLGDVAKSPLPLLVLGPTGTGKELVAQATHRLSGRGGAFVPINSAGLPVSLLEGELFGYRRGAFSGASEGHLGLARAAEGGTLFLDEVGDLPAGSQGVLLRLLQQKEVLPLGTTKPLQVDLRVIAATHRDLEAAVRAGAFREDLLARLAGYTVRLPPLAERPEDLGLVTSRLLARLAPQKAARLSFEPEVVEALFRHDWPRNIRELEQALASALAVCHGETLTLGHLPLSLRALPAPGALPSADAHDARRKELLERLTEHRGNVSEVARAMGKARAQVQRWIRRYRLDAAAFRR